MSDTLLLRTRPTTVEARQVTRENTVELARWIGGWTLGVAAVRFFDLNGKVATAVINDWVVKGPLCRQVVSDASLFGVYERVLPVQAE